MKNAIFKIILAAIALTAPALARADLIWYDGFNYSDGFVQYVSGGLWATNSTGGGGSSNDMYVVNGRLQVSATGGTGGANRVNDCNRLLSVTNNSVYTNSAQVLYASFTVICTNRPAPSSAGTYFASFYSTSPNGGGYYGRIYATTNGAVLPNTWRLAVSGTTTAFNHVYPVDLATNTPYQVVAQLDPVTLQGITLWVNPIDASDPSTTSGDVPAASFSTNFINAFAFRQASGFASAFFLITNLALATTFPEAATNVWATNALPPVIAYQPVGVTNYVNASISLAGVADGQGLGNMTYQWQQNGQNYTGGNGGTANILTISSAQTTDSGNFTLIATTPYGLSVTSAIAKVLITAQPAPPAFAAQPVSQTLYTGQNVIFTATVVSPGNLTYTWYSNNVVISAGQSDSGESSLLEIDNVQPSYSAVYKVAVTNDVYPTGIVSTNAVLTVQSPPAVSIAFLRTLVDPNSNYVATNSTQPYLVTGVVTTYTNLTSGDTSSYYLQDATAGINIFATFGSTFRPAQGDVVTFVGVLSSYSSGLELYADTTTRPYTSYTVVSNNFPLPAPLAIPFTITNNNFPAINYNIAGLYVQLTNVFFGTNAGTTIAASTSGGMLVVAVTNAQGQPFNLVFSGQDEDTQGQILPAFASSVTGVMFGSMNSGSPNFAVAVTKFSDINTNVPVVPIPLNIGYAGGTLTFNWTDPTFSLQWATNVTGPYTTLVGVAPGYTTNTTDQPVLFFRLSHP